MEIDKEEYLEAVFFWIPPALSSAERVLQADARFSPWSGEEGGGLSDREARGEAAMMLLALRNLLRAVEWFVRGRRADIGVDVNAILAQFHQFLPDLVDARNALEHFDEYAIGKGRLQRVNPGSYRFELIREPRPTVVVGPIRIDVRQARDAFRWLIIVLLAYFEGGEGEASGVPGDVVDHEV